ncbi:MAG: LbtU family siderophore porin [Bdellovibrionales bacterium]|jgi:hypothetical protein|nr:LbtU family siderophore porin [Bdellovibrionales bacterium]MBT3527209.1 LbtU family siderophore porin [Bdellovibrionales bacterium]MBT7670012.1 LbtU family siderophore porin [Bdellovibrionales bacterium]MBT7766579.1 LbtU family siderophore porin [Bdellovibrionales bacterium]
MSFKIKCLTLLFSLLLTTLLASAIAADSGLAVSGVVETEYSSMKTGGVKSSDIVAATAALSFVGAVGRDGEMTVDLLFEDDDTPLDVESAFITAPHGAFTLKAGRFFVPFGTFETNMVSDPITLDMAETNEAAIEVDYAAGPISLSFFIFNGDSAEASAEDKADQYGASVNFEHGEDGKLKIVAGAAYLNNFADTDGMAGALATDNTVVKYQAGYNFHFQVAVGDFGLIGEYVGASKKFDATDYASGAAKPSATHLEAYATVGNLTFALGMDQTKEATDIGLAEDRTLFAIGYQHNDSVAIGLEYMQAENYDKTKDSAITIQLAAEI